MIFKALRRIHKNQQGFTLIEVLVVMAILGILAAIVSISMLGITAAARDKAKLAELQNVQAAMDAMLSDQQVPASAIAAACGGGATNLMTAFPSGGAAWNASAGPAQDGHDTGQVRVLATHYLRDATTRSGTYTCDTDGKVTQH